MAKALIAAVVLAIALVAAVVVPMTLTSAGFDTWPKAPTHAPRAEVVSLDLPAKRVVRSEPAPRAVAPHRELAQAPQPAPRPVEAPPQVQQPQQPVPQQPVAAPEAPLPAPSTNARGDGMVAPAAVSGEAQRNLAIDGTNQR